MNDTELLDLLTSSNPLPAERAARLDVDAAQHELLAGLLAVEEPRRVPRRRRRTFMRAGFAVAAMAVALVAVLSLRDGGSDRVAWAAEQVRFAQASPLVILNAPGWWVEYADQESRRTGELQFREGPASSRQGIDTRLASLNWSPGAIEPWYEDRAASAAVTTTAPVLGTTARVYQYEGGSPGNQDITALFRYDGRVLEFRADAADIDAFKVLLSKLERVDTDAWLSAMPPSVIKTEDRDHTVNQMLQGVPLPPGFEPGDIEGDDLIKDRYQLGAAVAGTVACQWIKLWAEARDEGDRAGMREAIDAMATAKGWPVLEEMDEAGGYPDVLEEFAAAMPKGHWYGRPLTGDADSGLGCSGLGVDLP